MAAPTDRARVLHVPLGDHSPADPGRPDAPGAMDPLGIDALAWLAPSISHELANPLAALVAFSGLLAGDPRLPADLQSDVRLLRDEAERTARLVRTVLELLRERPPVQAPVDVAVLIDEVLELAAPRTAAIALVRAVEDPPPVAEADPSLVRRALVVMIVDALRALGDRTGGATLRADVQAAPAGRVVVAFEYRRAPGGTRGAVVGGQALPDGTTTLSGGLTIHVRRDEEGGRLALDLPSASVPTTDVAPRSSSSGNGSAGPDRLTVLVCDDEDAIRAVLVRVLERDGIRAIAAADAASALAAIEATAVDVVITDHRMTGMSGIELYERAIAARPALRSRFVLMSGEPGSDELQAFAAQRGVPVVPKPFDVPAIPALVRELVREDAAPAQRG